jgi:hypothetical protein
MTLDGLAGRLMLHPGAHVPVRCERPLVGATLLERLTQGRRAALLPDIIGAVFTLCADAQRWTSRRAIRAALGASVGTDEAAHEARVLALHVVREHLQRFALDLPTLAPRDAAPVSAQWLRDVPVTSMPSFSGPAGAAALAATEAALQGWLERRLLGMPPREWHARWRAERGRWLDAWCRGRDHALARWLAAVRDDALDLQWSCRALDVLHDADAGMRGLAGELAADAHFAERPLWRGAPAETGPWTHLGDEMSARTVWDRLGARLAEVARLAAGVPLAIGVLPLGDGEGIAWTEMSRGLLVHWVRLEAGSRDASSARAARYRLIAPTEWNFHPDGEFARWLRDASPNPARVGLAAAALDPCIAFTVEGAMGHA